MFKIHFFTNFQIFQASLQLQMANAKLETANERETQVEDDHKQKLATISKFHEEEQNKLKNLMEDARLEYLQQIENVKIIRFTFLKTSILDFLFSNFFLFRIIFFFNIIFFLTLFSFSNYFF